VKWLLALYPPGWRRRYGGELRELVAAQSFSIGLAFDLLAGAVDAWLHLELIAPTERESKGESFMIAKFMQRRCAGGGPDVSLADERRSAAMNIGGTLFRVLPWLWAVRQSHGNGYVLALEPLVYTIPYFLAMRYTSLGGRSGRAQLVLIAGLGGSLTAFLLFVGWVAARL
jgi:hypothetical protein